MVPAGRLHGRTAIVTGAGSGIGAACARLFAREGANVVVSDIDETGGERVVAQISKAGGLAKFIRHDVSMEEEWERVISETVSEFGALHVLVNNAGVGIGGLCEHFSLENWRKQSAVNMDGVFLGTKHAIPAIRKSGKGSIIIVSSGAGLKGTPGMSSYCATKGAVRLFAKAVALELAQMGDDIRVNSVHPGLVDTPIWSKADAETRKVFGADENSTIQPDALAQMAVPGGRLGQPEEIAAGILFLATDESSYINAAELAIDGGATAG